MIHELKILPEHFAPVLDELKTAELRKSDRPFNVGDTLLLMEWNGDYTGDACERVITHIADVGEYLPGYVMLSIKPLAQQPADDDWIEWAGGDCPVDSGVTLDVRFRDGEVVYGAECRWSWQHNGVESDIIAYRVVKP